MKTENRGGFRTSLTKKIGRPQEGEKKAIYIKVPIEYFEELNKACRELVRNFLKNK
jgi:hypothetical protein